MNPDTVVALAAATIGKTSSPKAHELRSSTRELTNGLHPDLDHRTVPVLDALAAICVTKDQHDVAAVALKLKLPKIELFLATNNETPEQETVEHLKDVWRILKELSDLHFHETGEKKEVDLREDSPPLQLPTGKQESLVNELHRLVHKHSYLKLCRRQEKYGKVIRRFWDLLKDKDSKNKEYFMDEEEQSLQEQMSWLILCLANYLHLLGEYHHVDWKVDEDQMSKFTAVLGGILKLANIILADGEACERWMDELKYEPNTRLRRAIEKLVTFHRQVTVLVSLAGSPRMRRMFTNTHFDVVPVDHRSPPSGNWPSNKKEWHELQDNVYSRHRLKRDELAPTSEAGVIQSLAAANPNTVHCECALISYLHRNRNEIPAFSYIGVSKLCCKPCYDWISAYNKHAKSGRYTTKGCHDKWYLGWKGPLLDPVVQKEVDKGLVKLVVREYCEIQQVLGKAVRVRSGSRSDSSNSSEPRVVEVGPAGRYDNAIGEIVEEYKKRRVYLSGGWLWVGGAFSNCV